MSVPYEIRVAADPADLARVHAVRRAVFIVEQEIPEDEEWDDLDPTSVHLLAVGPGAEPWGTGRLIHGPQALKITGREAVVLLGRLAVLKPARGTGLGAALVLAIEQAGRERGGRELELHAQVQALGFYERLGYVPYGAEYLDAGIPHRSMLKTL